MGNWTCDRLMTRQELAAVAYLDDNIEAGLKELFDQALVKVMDEAIRDGVVQVELEEID